MNAAHHHQRTPRSADRRRALFPQSKSTAEDGDLLLGAVLPLRSSSDEEEDMAALPQANKIADYAILEPRTPQQLRSGTTVIDHPGDSMSPLVLSPAVLRFGGTPHAQRSSPTARLQTPQESYSGAKLPRLVRKSDSGFKEEGPAGEEKGDVHCKVRLFSEDIGFSPRVFYPPVAEKKQRSKPEDGGYVQRKPSYVAPKNNRNRSGRKSGKKGMNGGVTHRIQRPKAQKKLSAKEMMKAVSIADEPALQEYMNDIKPIIETREPKRLGMITRARDDPMMLARTENKENSPIAGSLVELAEREGLLSRDCPLFPISPANSRDVSMADKAETKKRPLSPTGSSSKKPKLDLISFEADDEFNEDDFSSTNISDILTNLSNDSSTANLEDSILSPTSQMCDMASGLAINTPKKIKDLSNLPDDPDVGDKAGARSRFEKLFPMFNLSAKSSEKPATRSSTSSSSRILGIMKKLGPSQMLLDAGQKKFGATVCKECNFLYHASDPTDEALHANFHGKAHVFRHNGWKHERIVAHGADFRIIKVVRNDHRLWWKRVHDVMGVVDAELAISNAQPLDDASQVYLYIKSKQIVGVLVALPQSSAHRMLISEIEECSTKSYPVVCGVSKIWVTPSARRGSVATALMNCMRKNFVFGQVLEDKDVAVSAPTEAGKKFACRYFGTEEFLVFM